jgi:hypothetical protein
MSTGRSTPLPAMDVVRIGDADNRPVRGLMHNVGESGTGTLAECMFGSDINDTRGQPDLAQV